jgi:hypothetical protein
MGQSTLFVMKTFQSEMKIAPEAPPILIKGLNVEVFRAIHQRDLKTEFQTTAYGLSKIACMCPSCPFFKHKFSTDCDTQEFHPLLLEHISGAKHMGEYSFDLYSVTETVEIDNYIEFEGYFI